ncbi:MAG: hypothetical protein ACJAXB_002758, partial [Candidatus Endobugula sp.]
MNQAENKIVRGQTDFIDEIDLADIWKILFKGKWVVLLFVALFSIISIFYSLSIPNMYKASAVLVPADSSSGGAGLAGPLSGLASIAGITVGSGDSSKVSIAMEIIESWGFIEEFISKHEIAPEVLAIKGWDNKTGEMLYNIDLYDSKARKWKSLSKGGEEFVPSSWRLYQKFKGFLTLNVDKKSGLITISIEHVSPDLAKSWVDLLIADINEYMRDLDSLEATESIKFLKNQLTNTEINDMQKIFYRLIEDQMKVLMLAEASQEYALKTISKAKVPEQKSKPKRSIICILGALFGLFIGV